MKKRLYLVACLAIVTLSTSLLAQDAAQAGKVLNKVADEILSTEKTYRDGLNKLLDTMARHKTAFEGTVTKFQSNIVKKVLATSKIQELTRFIAEMDKVSELIRIIIGSSSKVKEKFDALKNSVKSAEPKEILTALFNIDNFFTDDKLYLRHYKEFAGKYTKFSEQYSNLLSQYIEKASFYPDVSPDLILAVQRGPRYSLFFQSIAQTISAWANANKSDDQLATLSRFSQELVENIDRRTKQIQDLIPKIKIPGKK